MKRPVFYMALPVTLIAAVMLFNQSSSKNCQNKSYCPQIQAGFNAGVDTLRPDPVCNMKVDDKKGDTTHYIRTHFWLLLQILPDRVHEESG